jgi:sulfur-oxidizing protein SoxY
MSDSGASGDARFQGISELARLEDAQRVAVASRRTVLVGAGAAALVATLIGARAPAVAQEKSNGFEETLKKILGDAKPSDAKIVIDMPEIAENGNTVPFSLTVDSPMTADDHVKAVHVISTGNPQPGVANFAFTPLSGKASVSSRMRLGRTQDVLAIAALSNGTFLMTKRTVKVTIGGCGG